MEGEGEMEFRGGRGRLTKHGGVEVVGRCKAGDESTGLFLGLLFVFHGLLFVFHLLYTSLCYANMYGCSLVAKQRAPTYSR